MAVIESTTDTQQFKPDTNTQEFLALTRIATNYQRMEQALTECLYDERNRLCAETYVKVSNLLGDLDESLL
jgi:hypothetical protein